ncbi:hypothetical protein SAMN04487898_101246 [Pedobacter sp. ok626]|uniref:hypothetical protein n=1 Tax=Pedobacter sp. ok626 TaxID=1761882 RepID=UPI00088C545C|nr:hypothetical protein [Pedobacter sp. ok626]SDJ07568.1 hypothetical protein SAMN04487898_101246 [Pedobacter sp. ok626]
MMMKLINKYAGFAIVMALIFSSCKKETTNIFNMFDDVKVTYHSNSPYAVTDFKVVNPGDSVYLEYTIESANKDMAAVCIFETSAAIPTKIFLTDDQRRSYSGIVKLKMNTRVGKISYRIWAIDKAGVYLGDGYKTITLDVKSDYDYWAGRELTTPDTVGKVNKCYYALKTGELFNYSNAEVNSSKIDLGLFRVPVLDGTGRLATYKYEIYALNANPLPFTSYDISSWTKRATLYSVPKNGQSSAFLGLRTGEQIVNAAKSAKPTTTRTNTSTGLIAGSLFYFLTPEGKYGAFYVNSIETNNVGKAVFMNVDVKIAR